MNTSLEAPMRPVSRMARIIAARFWRVWGCVATALALAGCSALQMGYNRADALLYWWVDAHVDLNEGQSARLRQDIDRFLDWHRRSELPIYAERLRQWRSLAAHDTTPEQTCAQSEALRAAAERLIERGHEPLARLALTLSPSQLQHMALHHAKNNETFEKDFLHGAAQRRLERRADRAVERYESLYGTLTAHQMQLVRQSLQDSPFDPLRTLNHRRARQAELRDLIRQMQATASAQGGNEAHAARTAAQALQAWLMRGLLGSPGGGDDAWMRHSCKAFAALHNTTTETQRRHAQQTLLRYEEDLRQLAAQD